MRDNAVDADVGVIPRAHQAQTILHFIAAREKFRTRCANFAHHPHAQQSALIQLPAQRVNQTIRVRARANLVHRLQKNTRQIILRVIAPYNRTGRRARRVLCLYAQGIDDKNVRTPRQRIRQTCQRIRRRDHIIIQQPQPIKIVRHTPTHSDIYPAR